MRGLIARRVLTCAVGAGVIAGGLFSEVLHAQEGSAFVVDEQRAVALALENNLGLQAERLATQVADMGVAEARSVWTPTAFTRVLHGAATSPATSVLSGTDAI